MRFSMALAETIRVQLALLKGLVDLGSYGLTCRYGASSPTVLGEEITQRNGTWVRRTAV